jgi:hypothetical protein
MMRFRAFHQGQPAKALSLESVHMFGQDEIPVRGELEFAEGELRSIRHNDTAVGVSTLWETEQSGKLLLQTTRLPVRDKFYVLNVEIARARLLRISQKREEWGLTDLTIDETQQQLMDQAMEKFIEALCHLDEPAKAAQFADQSLSHSMELGESLAMSHADLFLDRRVTTKGIKRHSFGCYLDTERITDIEYLKLLKENFQFVTIPVSWKLIEPKEQERQFEHLDACVNWLSKNRIAVKIGPLLNFMPESLPDWLFIWENDFEQVREMAYEYVSAVVDRYGKKVQAWDVISGLHANNCFKFSFEQIVELSRSATMAAKRAAARSLVLIELTEPWGEYYSRNPRTVPPLIYADAVYQSGIQLDGFSVQMNFGGPYESMRTRDLLEVSVLLDRFANFGKPIHLTNVQVPSTFTELNGAKGQESREACYWREKWSEPIQAQWLDSFYRIAMSKPFVETVSWHDLADREGHLLNSGGLVNKDLVQKPAFETLCQLKQQWVKAKTPSEPV